MGGHIAVLESQFCKLSIMEMNNEVSKRVAILQSSLSNLDEYDTF